MALGQRAERSRHFGFMGSFSTQHLGCTALGQGLANTLRDLTSQARTAVSSPQVCSLALPSPQPTIPILHVETEAQTDEGTCLRWYRERREVRSERMLRRPEPLKALPPECTGRKQWTSAVNLLLFRGASNPPGAPQWKLLSLHPTDVGTEPRVEYVISRGSHGG